MKRKGWIILAVAAVLVIGTYSWLKGSYNDMCCAAKLRRLNWEMSRTSISAEWT